MLIFTLLTETSTQQKCPYRKLNIYRLPVRFQVSHWTQYSLGVLERVGGVRLRLLSVVSALLKCWGQLDSTSVCGSDGMTPPKTDALTFTFSRFFLFSPLERKATRLFLLFHIPWCIHAHDTLLLRHSSYYAMAAPYVLFINNLYRDRP